MKNLLKELDIFDKFADAEFALHTIGGKFMSAIFSIIAVILIFAELFNYTKPIVYRDLLNIPQLDKDNTVNFTFSIQVALPCFFLHFDALDSIGVEMLDVSNDIKFKRMSVDNRFIDYSNESLKDICLPCHGLKPEGECCNTCDEVKAIFEARGEDFNPLPFDQCMGNVNFKKDMSESCLIEGTIHTFKSPGQFHIAPGRNTKFRRTGHQHDTGLSPEASCPHTIHEFYVGQKYDNVRSPIRGKIFRDRDSLPRIYLYDLFITKVLHTFNDALQYTSYEYSYNLGAKIFNPGSFYQPGIYFKYMFSPMTIVERSISKNPMRFLVTSVGVLAGIFAFLNAVGGMMAKICPTEGPRVPEALK
ncbi:hypothetical protein TVAG_402060 [Trichomonas vaginalis G3]|uniref:Uncharacterized protein n=1 Tax=Trichomonas vaginalis (strain ATCC PRA-98 / G3) TaxID=412133 RepID=A2DHW3_TRIV3|nr:vesicle-mediated transport [Trichomonas vaginalis G3]EAY19952.1 hypothetical protein TVAG_402060 [Trichomonas vaginalis G3]KAI5525902.1 vesicle-mediated transport [Trichomonas vaginalis G3]|eukprot:XP_001580938.1 hypothetical protein [Trichomonas vaginalis G3]